MYLVLIVVLAALPMAAPAAPPASGGASAQTLPPALHGAIRVDSASSTLPDSLSILREALEARASFERTRRNNLPWRWGSWGGECDEVVGRLCLRHSREEEWEPPPEAPAIVEARERLLERLAELAADLPGDDWILGQRVGYLGEQGRWKEARVLLEACPDARVRRDPWWCHALMGFVLHFEDAFPEAERAFRAALTGMPVEQAEEWMDLALLLDREGQRLIDELPEEEAGALARRIWSLSDPLFLVPGNDRWTAHMARRVMVRIREGGATTYGMSWGDDLAELLLRFGWEIGWERARPVGLADVGSAQVVGRQDPRSLRFVPSGEALRAPEGLDSTSWDFEARVPRSHYAPAYLREVEALDHQVALFRRGVDLLVVAGYSAIGDDPPPPSASTEAAFEAGLFLLPMDRGGGGALHEPGEQGEYSHRDAWQGRSLEGEGTFVSRVPGGDYILGLEVLDRTEKRAWRLRYDLKPRSMASGVPFISDLLFHSVPPTMEAAEEGFATAAEAEAIAPFALSGSRIRRGEPVGVAWEIYDLPLRDALHFEITIHPERGGRLRRAAEWIRLVSPPSPIVLAWTEAGPGATEVFFRSVELDLQAFEEGEYELRVEVALPGRSPLSAVRRFTILPPAE